MSAASTQEATIPPLAAIRSPRGADEPNRPLITIRPLTTSDWDTWWRLRLRALRDHPDAFAQDLDDAIAEGERVSRDRFETMSVAEGNRIFGALTAEQALVGVAGIAGNGYRKMRHRMEIWGVYVAPEARGGGAGGRLIDACVDHARRTEGVRQVHIGVASHNRAAARLYERCGFSLYAREPRLLVLADGTAIDEDLMVCMLDT